MANRPQQDIRVGIVGASPGMGWGSGVHRRVVTMLPGFTLAAVCTTREETARRAQAEYGAALAFTDAFELACHPDVDLVAVCVKAPHHHGIARAAIEAGKHVYCEWPLALTVEQADELAALAAARGVKAMIGLHLRGASALRTMAELIAEGFVGAVHSVNLHIRVFGPTMGAMALRAGGTTLLSIYGGHLLDAVDHYFGGIADVALRQAIHLPPLDETGAAIARDAADHLLFTGAFQNGALFAIDLAGTVPSGFGSRWRIEGSEGTLLLTTPDPSIVAVESLVLEGARGGDAMRPLPIAPDHEHPAIPATPDRYSAYPGSDAARAALVAIGNLYAELGHAIRTDGAVVPDFARAAAIQRLLGSVDVELSQRRR